MKSIAAMPVSVIIRLAKAGLTLATGVYAIIVVFGNLTDHRTNLNFIKHVVTMDTTFPDNTLMYRAIESPRVHRIMYAIIIMVESMIAILCTKGGVDMLQNLHSDPETFHQSKRSGISGLFLALLLWFFGFQAIAGEWFGMWMSKDSNSLFDASRLTQYISATLIFVSMKNDGE